MSNDKKENLQEKNSSGLIAPPQALRDAAKIIRATPYIEDDGDDDNQADNSNALPVDSTSIRKKALKQSGYIQQHAAAANRLESEPSYLAEFELCGWLLHLNPEVMPVAMHLRTRIRPADFVSPKLAAIYQSAMHFVEQNRIGGVAAVFEYATQKELDVGSKEELSALVSNPIAQAADVERINHNVDVILDHSQRRAMRRMLIDYAEQLDTHSAAQIKNRIEAHLHEFATLGSADNGPTHISELVESVIDGLNQDEDALSVIPTGFTDLDEQMGGGLRGGDYVIVGARPSMGKTAFALNLGRNISMDTRHNHNVLVFSGEMMGTSLASRLLSAEAAIPASALRAGGDEILGNSQYLSSLMQVIPRFAHHNPDMPHTSRLWIDDQSGLNSSQIATRAREFVRRYGKATIIVDYLQFISAGDYSRMTRNEQVSAISRDFKNLARELDSPVVMLSQLSRELEKRADKRPIMSDLRESGAIEQDADAILFLYRDVVYNPDTPEPDMAEVIIGKQRDGAIGTVQMTFNNQYVRFENRLDAYYES